MSGIHKAILKKNSSQQTGHINTYKCLRSLHPHQLVTETFIIHKDFVKKKYDARRSYKLVQPCYDKKHGRVSLKISTRLMNFTLRNFYVLENERSEKYKVFSKSFKENVKTLNYSCESNKIW